MLPFQTVQQYLRFTPPVLCEIVFEIRNLVAEITPNATEDLRHGGLVYYFGETGGPVSAGICGVAIKPDHIRLYFTHGAFIPDRSQLLEGSGKAMRYLTLISIESAPWEEIRVLIKAHTDFDPRRFNVS